MDMGAGQGVHGQCANPRGAAPVPVALLGGGGAG